jgi:hypothetical protein
VRTVTSTFLHALRLACACLALLASPAAASEVSLAADFDGDGQHDHVQFDRNQPSVLRVWLSKSNTHVVIHSRVPLTRVLVVDLDGDHRAEVVASGGTRGVEVWTKSKSRHGFKAYRARHAFPLGIGRPAPHADDEPTPPESSVSGADSVSPPCVNASDTAALFAAAARSLVIRPTRHSTPTPYVAPFAPRPPPVSA